MLQLDKPVAGPYGLLTVLSLCLGGCADVREPGSDRGVTTPSGVTRLSADPAAELLGRGIVADLEVDDASGPRRFHVETIQGTCTRLSSGRGSWAIRLMSGSTRPWSLDLSIPDAGVAERGTEIFALAVVFGGEEGHVRHEIDGKAERASAGGAGLASVLDSGGAATVVVEGLTRDGVRLLAIIRCRHVTRRAVPDAG